MDKMIVYKVVNRKNNREINKSQRIKTDNWLYYCHLTKYHLFDGLKKIQEESYALTKHKHKVE